MHRVVLLALVCLACAPPPRLLVDIHTDFADAYATDVPPGDAALGERAPEIAALVQDAAQALLHRPLTPDPRLAQVADWVAEEVARGHRPQAQRRVAATTRAGVPFPTPGCIDIRYSPGIATDRLRDSIRHQLAELGQTNKYARVGVAVRTTPTEHVAVLILTAADVSFAPVPRHVTAGDNLVVRGQLEGTLQHARLVVTQPDGHAQNAKDSEGDFDFVVKTPVQGTYAVELVGEGPLGPLVVANFPVYADLPEPPIPTEGVRETVTTSDAVETELLQLVNEERQKLGLKPLIPWPLLANVARAHSQDMAEHDFVAHVSPTQGTPEDRLRRAGIGYAGWGENVALAPTTAEIHAGLMASPGHRAAIVNPGFTHIGIGASLKLMDKQYVPVVTEEFVTAR